jgi:hypothetical protein
MIHSGGICDFTDRRREMRKPPVPGGRRQRDASGFAHPRQQIDVPIRLATYANTKIARIQQRRVFQPEGETVGLDAQKDAVRRMANLTR